MKQSISFVKMWILVVSSNHVHLLASLHAALGCHMFILNCMLEYPQERVDKLCLNIINGVKVNRGCWKFVNHVKTAF